jgi:hypothetical protein
MAPMRFVLIGAILFVTAAAGCTEPRSARCKTVCEREATCAEKSDDPDFRFDQQECVSACAALERDAEGKKYVARHAECVDAADSCDQIYACNLEYQEAPKRSE